jgi:hypothetical protein
MKKLVGSLIAVILLISFCGCGSSSGSGTHIATNLNQSSLVNYSGSWAVSAASLRCDNAPKMTTATAIYSFNSNGTGTYVVSLPASGMFPATKQTVNFEIKASDTTSFTIKTTGNAQCTYLNGQSCVFGSSAYLPISAANPVTTNFQFALSPSGTSLNLAVNDNTDQLTCALGTTYSSKFSATRQ